MSAIEMEHLVKFLKTKRRKGVHGSVQIIIKDGEFFHVNDNCSYNASGFVQLCDKLPKPPKRLTVKSYTITEQETEPESVQNYDKNVEKAVNLSENEQDSIVKEAENNSKE